MEKNFWGHKNLQFFSPISAFFGILTFQNAKKIYRERGPHF
jgi:hypothetical protein